MILSNSPIRQLDDSLKIIAKKYPDAEEEEYYYKTFGSIYEEIRNLHPSIEMSEMQMILDKLMKDGFISTVDMSSAPQIITPIYYSITFEGKLHIQLKGYEQQLKDKRRKEVKEQIYNLAVAVGTLLAGIYGLLEIVKLIIKYFSKSPC